jgi:hypothetical protein
VNQHLETRIILALVSCAVIVFAAASVLGKASISFARTDAKVPTANDPVPGGEVQLPSTDVKGRDIARIPTLLVVLGECAGCAAKKTDYAAIRSLGWPQIVYIFEENASQVLSEEESRKAIEAGYVIADATGAVCDRLNVLWTPRWYVLDSNARLVASQPNHQEPFPEFSAMSAEL